MSAYSGEFWHVRQNIYFNFLAQNVWEASKNKVPFWLTAMQTTDKSEILMEMTISRDNKNNILSRRKY